MPAEPAKEMEQVKQIYNKKRAFYGTKTDICLMIERAHCAVTFQNDPLNLLGFYDYR